MNVVYPLKIVCQRPHCRGLLAQVRRADDGRLQVLNHSGTRSLPPQVPAPRWDFLCPRPRCRAARRLTEARIAASLDALGPGRGATI